MKTSNTEQGGNILLQKQRTEVAGGLVLMQHQPSEKKEILEFLLLVSSLRANPTVGDEGREKQAFPCASGYPSVLLDLKSASPQTRLSQILMCI